MTRPTDIVVPSAVHIDMQKKIDHHLSQQHNNETTMKDRAIRSLPDLLREASKGLDELQQRLETFLDEKAATRFTTTITSVSNILLTAEELKQAIHEAIEDGSFDSRGHLENLVKDKATVTVELPVQLAVNLIADEVYGDDYQAAAMDIVGLVDSAMDSQHGVDDDDVRDYWNASSGGQS